jgi:hypothetical protein
MPDRRAARALHNWRQEGASFLKRNHEHYRAAAKEPIMLQRTPHFNTHLAAAAEQQMRKWTIGLEVQERLKEHEKAAEQLLLQIRPYVAISRETGAGGGAVAQRLHEILGWDILGRKLLDCIAERYGVSRNMLDAVDEAAPNWVSEVLGKWLDHQLVTPSQYLHQLGHVVLLAARAGNCIFIGRGAQFILPADRGIAVRLVAPLEMRIASIMELDDLQREEAAKLVCETDCKRRDFIAHQFRRNIDDLDLYDLALNRRDLDIDAAAEIIAREVRRRFEVPVSPLRRKCVSP